MALLAFASCAKPSASDPAPSTITPKILHVGNGAEPQNLDPHTLTGSIEFTIVSSLFEGLVTKHPSGFGVAPGVAESWATSPDGLVWTFHLRSDARWSDATPLTSADFLRSFQRMLDPALGAENAYRLYPVAGAEAYHRRQLDDFTRTGFSAPDPRTLVLRLKHPVPEFLEALRSACWMPAPIHVIEKLGPANSRTNPWIRPANFVGNGPFTLKRWLPHQAITVERSPTYWNAASVNLDSIVFHPIDDINTEERMFRSGQLHITKNLPPDKIDTYRRDQPAALRVDPLYGTYFLRLNLARPPLDDPRVRRALALAIDREAIVNTLLRAGQAPAWQFTPPFAGFTPTAALRFDPSEARRLLAEAGYPAGTAFPKLEFLYNTSELHRSIAEAIQHMWKTSLGIHVALRNEEWKVYLDSCSRQSYDIARAGWIDDYANPLDYLGLLLTGGGNNYTGYANPAFDRLHADARSAQTPSTRLALYQQADALLTHDLPVIPLYFYKSIYLLSPRVKNWPPDILGLPAWHHVDLDP